MEPKCTIDQIKDVLSELQSQLDAIQQSKKDTDLPSKLDATTPQSTKANVVENNEKPVEKKRPSSSSSWWDWIRVRFRKGSKVKKETSPYASDGTEGSQGGSNRKTKRTSSQDQDDANLEISKLQNDIRQMKGAFENLAHFQRNISKSLETEVPSKKLKAILSKTDSVKSRSRDLKEIRRKVLNLKSQIPALLKKQASIGLSITGSQTAEENGPIVETGSDIFLPGLHVSYDFKQSSAFEQVVEKFEVLEFNEKLCLLSFAVFPENKEVKRTMLMYWWIGEGFIGYEDSETTVTSILYEFSRQGLLEAVEDERKLKPSGYKMEPHVHYAVICLAARMRLFDLCSSDSGKLKMQKSEKHNVCLVKGSSLQKEAKASEMEKNLNSVFNSSERYPDFTFKWFPEMDSLKVLYLGRWERTAKRHIEVESTKFLLKNIKSLKSLRLASFQGISRIENLKDLDCSLPKLVILDFRACYNLEVLPDNIGSLKSLIYLDVSECYMLDRMPEGISCLKTLEVLKGFVISQSDHEKYSAVKHLENLRKLSITVNNKEFKVEDFMESLKDLNHLESLKIAWGAPFPNKEDEKGEKEMQQGHTTEEKHKDPKEDGNEKAKLEEGKKSLKSDKTSPSQESTETIQEKPENGDKGKDNQEEEKKQDEVSLKSEKKADDEEGKSKVGEDGDKWKDATEEGKKQDKVDAEKARSENGVEGVKKVSPSSESTNAGDKEEEKGDGEKEKVNLEEGKKKDEVKEVSSKPDKVTEGDEKTSPPQDSKDTVKSKQDDHQRDEKQEEKREGVNEKMEEGKKKDEVKAVNSKPDEKTSPPQESKDQSGDKQEEKRDGEKDKIEEVKNKDEIKAENSKPDNVDEKTSPAQQSKDTIQSKPPDDQKENNKVQEKGDEKKIKTALKKPDGGEAKTQKLDKNKLGKKVSFSEEPRAPVQKKPDDMKKDMAMEKENHETASTSKSKKTGFRRLFTIPRSETKRQVKGGQEDSEKENSKLPSSLTKLELECYPEKEPPVWLNPKTLDKLKKLSIKGGNLTKFSDEPLTEENKCSVQILRLKYLHNFKAEWKDLHALFPQLKLLEKYKCPEVAFCPTDGNGVWRSQP